MKNKNNNFDRKFKDILSEWFSCEKNIKNILFNKVKKEVLKNNLFKKELVIDNLKYVYDYSFSRGNILIDYCVFKEQK